MAARFVLVGGGRRWIRVAAHAEWVRASAESPVRGEPDGWAPRIRALGPAAVSVEDERVVGKMMRVGNEIAVREGFPQYRTVCNNGAQAGQTVFHLHMHILGGRSMTWPPG